MTRSSRRTPGAGTTNETNGKGRSKRRVVPANIIPNKLSVTFEKKNGTKKHHGYAAESDIAARTTLAASTSLTSETVGVTQSVRSDPANDPVSSPVGRMSDKRKLVRRSGSWSHPDRSQGSLDENGEMATLHRSNTIANDDGGSISDSASPVDVKDNNNSDGALLRGFMLKRGSRNHYVWNKRYFIFTRDCKLLVYKPKSADDNNNATQDQQQDQYQLKGVYEISKQAGCEIGNLFVEQRMRGPKKETLYCFRIKWSDEDYTGAEDHLFQGNPQKLDEASYNSSSFHQQQTLKQNSSMPSPPQSIDDFLFPLEPMSPTSDANNNNNNDKERHSDNSVNRFPDIAPSNSNCTSGSTKGRGHRRRSTWGEKEKLNGDRPVIKRMATGAVSGASKSLGFIYNHSIGNLPLTSNHKEKEKGDKEKKASSRSEGEATQTSAGQKLYDEQELAEQDYLRAEYKSVRKEKKRVAKKKVAQTVKVAAAATAAVGIGVITAGVGLATGLALVGVAAGGSGAALGMGNTGKRRDKNVEEIIIATDSYEDAKKWKSTLDAYLQFETVRESTWGQLFFSPGGNHPKSAHFPTDIVFHDRPINSPHHGGIDEIPAKSRNKMSFSERQFVFEPSSQWRPLEGGWASLLGNGVQGLRIFKEEKVRETELPPIKHQGHRTVLKVFTKVSVDGPPCPPMKAHVVLNTTPLNAFLCLMSNSHLTGGGEVNLTSFSPKSDQGASFRIIERIDDHMDIIHVVFRPIYLFPSWTTARDYVMIRYWRVEQDGTYVVIYESVQHQNCPAHSDFVRGEMHQVYTIAPRKRKESSGKRSNSSSKRSSAASADTHAECLISAVVQVDPKGWVPVSSLNFLAIEGYGDAFGIAALMQLLDIRDAIDRDRFTSVSAENAPQVKSNGTSSARCLLGLQRNSSDESANGITPLPNEGDEEETVNFGDSNYDFSFSGLESLKIDSSPTGLPLHPEPLKPRFWAEPESNSFRVRGPNYLNDKIKINASSSIGRLFTVDMVEVDKPILTGFGNHPTERIQLALQKDKMLKEKGLPSDFPAFIFVVNIIFPGPPHYHAVMYYAIDDYSTIDGSDGSPSSLLARKFFFDEDDEFRDRTFKLIPQIVAGNFMVRKAVGSTPALLGKKIDQLYIRGDRFFEVICDTSCSAVAANVIRLSIGYAKTLVVDMGFVFEGDDEETLPEKLFGCVRLKNIDMRAVDRKVKDPEDL